MGEEVIVADATARSERWRRRQPRREASYGIKQAVDVRNLQCSGALGRSSRKSYRLVRMHKNRQRSTPSPDRDTTVMADDSEASLSSSPTASEELQILAQASSRFEEVVTYSLTPPGLILISSEHRQLLEYFQHGVCQTICTNPYRVQEFCATVLPFAHTNQCALAAVLALALSYRSFVTTEPSDEQRATKMCLLAIRLLRESLDTPPDHRTTLVALTASLLLSIGNIFSSGAPKIWHFYLDGALVLREKLGQHPATAQLKCLRRWCRFLKITTFNSDSGDIKSGRETDWSSEPNHICDLSGISPDLSPILERIRDFCRRHNADKTLIHDIFGQLYVDYIRLIEAVTKSLRRRSRVIQDHNNLSAEANRDLWLLDEAYHHVALLQLHLCMHTAKTPLTLAIRASVRRIIDCIGGMNLTKKPNYVAYTVNPLRQACKSAMVREDKEMLSRLIKQAQGCVPIASFTRIQRYLY
ncbi:hypothetical protein NLG97_g5589 [Lecanicillium saksenae]|uniref:Uncharacterized protein n=1 Tax=Lecanicillium saksenae TaxID=468837 RepID=A0ACC1QTY3_9HYPO|nr:hypothetical protein NLG97_g5589 [Lecanicillium saksenae]